ncbi:MAG: FtsW/RodA/SpoVE family cell cycle protein [Thermomicrobiales bacterium]
MLSLGKWKDFDVYMLVTTIVLMGFGVVAIWSATGEDALALENLGVRQAVFGVAGIAVLFLMASIDYRFFASFSWFIYLGGLAVLVLVLVPQIGTTIGGSQRWIDVGPYFSFQPSEFGKLATILALAAFVSSRGSAMSEFGNFVVSILIVAVPMVLVFVEPDLGSTAVYAVIWASMMVVARTRKIYFAMIGAVAIPALLVAWEVLFLDPRFAYMKERLLISYEPERDPLGQGFNIFQARISIGSGGLLGHGLEGGSQSQLELLRVRETDFIFAHASGMFGFLGMLALFASIVILLWRCLRVAEAARDSFGQCVALGVTGALFFQAFINIGMNVGLMPVTGITLPFVSYGVSSLWTFLAAEGIMQSILMRQRKLGFQPD